MALTYRSPVEEVLTLLEPTSQSLIASTATKHLEQSEKDNYSWFSYSLPAYSKEQLSRAGIYLSPYSGYPHSHPVCKTLENYLLYSVLPNLINNTFYFVGIKNFKLNFLKTRFKNLSQVSAINRYVTSADKLRYGNEFVYRESSEVRGLARHKEPLNSNTLKTLVPNIKTGSNLFFHDELHYWSKEDLITFLEVVQPETMLATIVYPSELFIGAKKSLNPWCYEIEVISNRFTFYPDGVRSEGYEQPLNGGYLLKSNYIMLPNGQVYSVDVHCSKFAHHLVSITRGELVTPRRRSFGPFEAVDSEGLKSVDRKGPVYYPVSHQFVSRMYRYLRSLKKPDKQSAIAKLSQLVPDSMGGTIRFVEEFSNLVINNDTLRTSIDAESMKSFFGNIGAALPQWMGKHFSCVKSVCLEKFITSLRPLSVNLELVPLRMNIPIFDWSFFSDEPLEHSSDILEKMEVKWAGAPLERSRTPYASLLDLTNDRSKYKILCNEFHMGILICPIYMSAFCSDGVEVAGNFSKYREALLQKANLISSVVMLSLSTATIEWIEQKVKSVRGGLLYFATDNKRWFLQRRSRLNVWCIGSKVTHDSVNNFEDIMQYMPTQRKLANYVFSTYSSYDELDDWYASETPVQPGKTKKEENSGPESEVKEQEELHDTFAHGKVIECACGMHIEVLHSKLVNNHAADFPDPLKGRMAGWYARNGEGYSYTGGKHKSLGWPIWLELWMKLHGLDESYYNCMLAQRYVKGAKVAWHADDESCFEANSRIMTVNVKGQALFGLRCKVGEVSFTLDEGDMFEMPEGCQCSHKHTVESKTEDRISFTFRRMVSVISPKPKETTEPNASDETGRGTEDSEQESAGDNERGSGNDFNTYGVEIRDVEYGGELRVKKVPNTGGGDCFWLALSHFTKMTVGAMKAGLGMAEQGSADFNAKLKHQLGHRVWAEDEAIIAACGHFGLDIHIYDSRIGRVLQFSKVGNKGVALLHVEGMHFMAIEMLEACTFRAVAQVVNREVADVQAVVHGALGEEFEQLMLSGEGVMLEHFAVMLELFDIHGIVYRDGEVLVINPKGTLQSAFEMKGSHVQVMEKGNVSAFDSTNIRQPTLEVEPEKLASIVSAGTSITYRPEVERAKNLADCLLKGLTGVVCSSLYNQQGSLYKEESSMESCTLNFILGTFGSGKSTLFKRLLETVAGKSLIYISPRRALCDDFKRLVTGLEKKKGKASVRNFRVYTFETGLQKMDRFVEGSVLILDEIQLFPPGYVDLSLNRLAPGCKLFLVGDPCQSDYDSEKDRNILSVVPSDVNYILSQASYRYNILSHRFKVQDLTGRLPCEMEGASRAGCELKLVEGLDGAKLVPEYLKVCLVSSFEEKKIVNNFFGAECKCYTFGESTGLTFGLGSILVTHMSVHTSEQRWLTALSRFRDGLVLINSGNAPWDILKRVYAKRVLGRFIDKTARKEDLLEMLPGEPQFVSGFNIKKIGADEGKREEKLSGDPWLKSMINLFQIEDQEIVEEAQVVMEDPWFKTHLPPCEMEGVRARWTHRILAKEFREKRMGHLVSEQFTDEHSRQPGKRLTNAAERFETIYPRHRASDTVTFIMAVRKRLRFSDPMRESAKLQNAMPYGPFLLKKFLERIPLKPMHDQKMMAEALHDFEEKKTSKSAATIENHSNRSCRDWLADVGLVFSKSQLCTKFDNRFRDAKAAQTIVCFQHSVLCRFAPYMRYIEKKLAEVLPRKYYIHSGKGLEELNDWVIQSKFEGLCTESDYEAFDASQDQYIVAFEIQVMRFLGLPNDLIEDYKYIKTHLGSKLGNFAIMRFSGEASTFLFNTMANMLFTFLRYDLTGVESICFAGDDMCANRALRVSTEHEGFLKKLKLKAKVDRTNRPTFCGWSLSPQGIYKKPQLVYERMCIAKETANLHNCIDNYAIEVSYAYKLGEVIKEYMNEEELDAMYNCVRVIVKNKHLLKSDVLQVYQTGLLN